MNYYSCSKDTLDQKLIWLRGILLSGISYPDTDNYRKLCDEDEINGKGILEWYLFDALELGAEMTKESSPKTYELKLIVCSRVKRDVEDIEFMLYKMTDTCAIASLQVKKGGLNQKYEGHKGYSTFLEKLVNENKASEFEKLPDRTDWLIKQKACWAIETIIEDYCENLILPVPGLS
jgi:hypothetical protein